MKLRLTSLLFCISLLQANTDGRYTAYHEVYLLSLEAYDAPQSKKEKAEAAWVLAKLYAEGKGVPKNEKKSLLWYMKAAKYQHVKAMEYLMQYCFSEIKDVDKGILWAYKAAKLNSDLGISTIGLFYEQADKLEEAASWYEKGYVSQGANSTYYLALMYFKGKWFHKDIVKAQSLFEKARSLGHKKAKAFLVKNYKEKVSH